MNSHAEGLASTASGSQAHAEGTGTTASASHSHAECGHTVASGSYSHAEGNGSTASGEQSHAEGNATTASGTNAHTEGSGTIANSRSQHVFGEYNVADANSSVGSKGSYIEIVGNGTGSSARSNARTLDWDGNEKLAGGLTLEGPLSRGRLANSTVGNGSMAFGYRVTASGSYSTAIGEDTSAWGNNSHAQGAVSYAIGDNSDAAGQSCYAVGDNSSATGRTAIATKRSQHVFGEYNIYEGADVPQTKVSERGQYVEIVGNGVDASHRANARTLDWDGNEALAGSLTLGKGTADEVTITAAQLKALLALLS